MAQAVDFESVKDMQRQVWSKGDFAMVATTVVTVAEQLCESAEVLPGDRVLDVACGSGNVSIAAARRFATVTGIDYVPALLDHGRERARAEGMSIDFVEGDAEALPFEDGSFDVVLSTFGTMFAPNQPRAAAEMLRVCRPGGTLGNCAWTPDGMVGEMFKVVTSHAPPPAKLDPPVLWGTEERVRELLGDGVSSLRAERRELVFRYHSPEHCLEFFRTWFGPTMAAYERLDEAGQQALTDDLLALYRRHNMAGESALVAPSSYLEVVATRSG